MEIRIKVALLGVLIASASVSGCFYPGQAHFNPNNPALAKYATCANREPDPKAPPSTEFDSAVTFASETKREYTEFLTDREKMRLGSGLALIGLAGASLGLTTTAASTNAATATGLASGTGLAGYTWVTNKAKDTAYTQATNQLQCVLTKASILEPLRTDSSGATKIDGDVKNIADEIDPLAKKVRDTESKCQKAHVGPSTAKARLAIAEATAARDRANALQSAFISAPVSIVNAVCAIDSAAFVAAQGGMPDATGLASAIGKVGPQPKPSGSSTSTQSALVKPVIPLQVFVEEQKETATKLERECEDSVDDLNNAAAKLIDDTKELKDKLGNINWTPQGFADCLKVASSPSPAAKPGTGRGSGGPAGDQAKTSNSDAPGPGSGAPNFHVSLSLFGWMPLRANGTTGTVTVSGGLQPYRWYVVDPWTYAVPASQDSSSLVLNLKGTNGKWRHRVLIADYAGNEVVVDVTPE